MSNSLCFGVDVGGTFTDCVLTEGSRTWRAKAPTTPGDIGAGVLAAAELAAGRRGTALVATLPQAVRFGLGTTAVTNMLASRTGRRVGLLATAGFEEMLPYARGTRLIDDDGWLTRPDDIVSRSCIVGIRERVDRDGKVVVPIDVAGVERAAAALVEGCGVEAIAVSFLWSFVNPAHEDLAVAAIRRAYPDLTVLAGSALHPAPREYERTTFAVLNAYVSDALGGIEALESDLRAMGLTAPLLLVHSGGGSVTVAEARSRPLGLAVSGPTAGVSAAVLVAGAAHVGNVLTCDMGGTSFDVSVVEAGVPARRRRGELMGVWTALALVDVESIGAGGGSLGWVDARGMLRVGPRSAGAVPGPACYGRSGEQATVTDALVVLGYIDPDRFLGGDFSLDREAARQACARLGSALGLDADEIAWGIRQLALAGMSKATRARAAALGLDPRQYALLSFGGSGSLFTPDIAAAIGARTVLVPELASVLSAFGAATTDVRRERLRSVSFRFPIEGRLIDGITDELATAVRADLAADGIAAAAQTVSFEADLRFAKQTFDLTIPLSLGPFDTAAADTLLRAFRAEYAKRYGQGAMVLGAPIEVVAIRAVGVGATPHAELRPRDGHRSPDPVAATPVAERSLQMQRGPEGRQPVAAYDGTTLEPGHTVAGPAVIDGRDTTIWVPAGGCGTVDAYGTLVMEVHR